MGLATQTAPAANAAGPAMQRPRLGALLGSSWAILRAHPVVSAALGGAVVLSLASILFAIGALVTPWFLCEIFALQLGVLRGRPASRGPGWIRAGLVLLGVVGLVLSATWLAALAVGPDVSTADRAISPLPWLDAMRRGGLIAAVTALSVGFIAPFLYAPLILIDRGGSFGAAILRSAWMVRRGGLLRHWALAFLAHLLPLAPALVAAVVVARTFERAATPVGALLGLPLLPISIPLGMGLISAAYEQRRGELVARRGRGSAARAPLPLVAALIALVLAPMAGVGLLMGGSLRPSPPRPGAAPVGNLVLDRSVLDRSPDPPGATAAASLHVPDTTLAIEVDGRRVSVHSGDGGGAGVLRTAWREPIERVRVVRLGDLYAVELSSAEGRWTATVDRAAMRHDDSVQARLRARVPSWALLCIALAFALHAVLAVRALAALEDLRRAAGAAASGDARRLAARRRRTLRRVAGIAAALAVPSALAVAGGLLAWE